MAHIVHNVISSIEYGCSGEAATAVAYALRPNRPRRAGPSPRGEATQGALLTTVFSYVDSVRSKDIEWAALAFTNQLAQRDLLKFA